MSAAAHQTFEYIEVIRKKDGAVVKRIDVTGKSDRQQDAVERGVGINLNHKEYRTSYSFYKQAQPLDPAA